MLILDIHQAEFVALPVQAAGRCVMLSDAAC